jgi:dTDP-glucose 4,6-dehydratase
LGFTPGEDFESGIARTVAWYCENLKWWRPLKQGAFQAYYRKQYGRR